MPELQANPCVTVQFSHVGDTTMTPGDTGPSPVNYMILFLDWANAATSCNGKWLTVYALSCSGQSST